MKGKSNFGFSGVGYVPGIGFVEDPIRKALSPNMPAALSGDMDVMMISGLGQTAPESTRLTTPVKQLDMVQLTLYALAILGAWTALKWLTQKVA